MKVEKRKQILIGVLLLFGATLSTAFADGVIKNLSGRLDAPQVFFISGFLMAAFTLVSGFFKKPHGRGRWSGVVQSLKTKKPMLIFLRSLAMVLAAISFFYAVANISLAEVFIFIGLMPLMAAFLSRFILGEKTHPLAWLGFVLGFIGLALLSKGDFTGLGVGYALGFVGAFMGTLSLVLSRLITKYENNSLVQVFYPNMLLGVVSFAMLPVVWVNMFFADVCLIVAYSSLLFIARWTMVLVMQRLRASVALPLMNVQFVWMVLIGLVFFAEVPSISVYVGAFFVILAGLSALVEQVRVERFLDMKTTARRAIPSSMLRSSMPIPAE